MRWISVRNWRKFQHYDPDKRQPPWIKNYTELLHSNEYLRLPPGTRSLLHGLWLEYASSRCQLPLDTRSLSRRLNLRVTMQQLKSLNRAGFIDIVASDTLAEGYRDASAALASRAPARSLETETEEVLKEKSKERALPVARTPATAPESNGTAPNLQTRKTEAPW